MFDEEKYAPLLGAFDGTKLVAMAQLYVSQEMMTEFKKDFSFEQFSICEIGGSFVLPEYRGRGIMTALQKMLLEIAYQRNFDYVIAMVHPENIASIKTLEKVGLKFYKSKTMASGFDRNIYMLKLK